ncbi:DUF3291 domain-containing protein [Amycolatopsis sp. OK19-0408]|uniref:DUF3291 domain-containing protein n=1 Tax=Amycolatopsis iheyensis TaxID=2945988 RepID=A0A9X2NAP8_9PSEU|nr:DUF3291 domain-containing protein [Amycolatopsis iheyensis]MCR6483711.1 DUF3291 domain-containing protein [Amycolatopsis iheyensis]
MAELAQVNIAVPRAPLDDPAMAGFANAFDAVAKLAEASPGFRWRLGAASGHAVLATAAGVEVVVNVSVWRDYRSLHQFVYRSAHGHALLRRREWFASTRQPATALWWVRRGVRPDVEQALARLRFLQDHGPSPRAFSLLRQFTEDGRLIGRRGAGGLAPSGG